ncbi:MAG: polyprenol monophosphomannose synthase [Chthonomonadaceae bacterium]|nr:polyprenol monophosphomannose synthase [Chthonomonadaceae bacterium]
MQTIEKMQGRRIVIVPTYNEAENILRLAGGIAKADSGLHLLVMDDNSPDGTAQIALKAFAEKPEFANFRVIVRSGKRGLGRAYVEGFLTALEEGYERIIQMDADLSHDPTRLTALLEATENSDVAIGSRYCPGGSVENWAYSRILLSRFACRYVHAVARIPIADVTAGYRCWSSKALRAIQVETIQSDGYSFQVEMAHRAIQAGMSITEVPICFTDRVHGKSKISRKVLLESFVLPWRLRFHPWKPTTMTSVFRSSH